jgi:hypothetical protein
LFRFTVTIKGNLFTGATNVDLGQNIDVTMFDIVDDGTITIKIELDSNLAAGPRDVTVWNNSGAGVLSNGFTVT